MTAKIITVDVERRDDGWLVGTSKAMHGLYIAHQDLHDLLDDVPNVIAALIKAETGEDVRVVQGDYGTGDLRGDSLPWVMLPPEVISQRAS